VTKNASRLLTKNYTDEDKSFKSDDNKDKNNLKSEKKGVSTISNLDERKNSGNWPNTITYEPRN